MLPYPSQTSIPFVFFYTPLLINAVSMALSYSTLRLTLLFSYCFSLFPVSFSDLRFLSRYRN